MSLRPREVTTVHTRLLKCTLEVESARAYWAHHANGGPASAHVAFDAYWFGARSLSRVQELLTELRARYDAFPSALAVLSRWPRMEPTTRRSLCHWHLQLADPLYRRFTGDLLVTRRAGTRGTITRDLVVAWVVQQGAGSWAPSTCVQFASKLLSAAHTAGLVASKRDPRPVVVPRVDDQALEYLLYLLRETTFAGTHLDNPYLRSLGLEDPELTTRLRQLPGLSFQRQGNLIDFGWRHRDLSSWAAATFGSQDLALAEVAA